MSGTEACGSSSCDERAVAWLSPDPTVAEVEGGSAGVGVVGGGKM